MGVIYIGDRATGKTSLAMELINFKFNYVKTVDLDYQQLRNKLFNEQEKKYQATRVDQDYSQFLELEIKLPAGQNRIPVEWLDTAGEIWRRTWQEENPQRWQQMLSKIQQSEGILLVLPPYREMPGLMPHVDASEFPTQQQWCYRFQRWADFFSYQCPQARHIVICLNKADLFCDIRKEAFELGYQPLNSRRNWFQRNSYVKEKYFRPILEQINKINSKTSGLSVRCFITTIHQRDLLELPWIYLGSHLAS